MEQPLSFNSHWSCIIQYFCIKKIVLSGVFQFSVFLDKNSQALIVLISHQLYRIFTTVANMFSSEQTVINPNIFKVMILWNRQNFVISSRISFEISIFYKPKEVFQFQHTFISVAVFIVQFVRWKNVKNYINYIIITSITSLFLCKLW